MRVTLTTEVCKTLIKNWFLCCSYRHLVGSEMQQFSRKCGQPHPKFTILTSGHPHLRSQPPPQRYPSPSTKTQISKPMTSHPACQKSHFRHRSAANVLYQDLSSTHPHHHRPRQILLRTWKISSLLFQVTRGQSFDRATTASSRPVQTLGSMTLRRVRTRP